jgi:outer membrane receptor protein involved in Fe transport
MKVSFQREYKALFISAILCLFFINLSAQGGRKSDSTQDVPISVTAFSPEHLQNQGISNMDLNSIASFAPSVVNFDGERVSNGSVINIRGAGGSNVLPNWNLRGVVNVNNTANTSESSDFTRSAFTANLGLDIERIEVLKGPQGILFGANVAGGIINTTQETSSEDLELNQTTFNYGVRVGAILPLDGPHVTAVTTLGYFNEQSKYDDGDETCSGLRINAGLRTWFDCAWMDICHNGLGSGYSQGKYNQGSIMLGGMNRFNWDIGSINSTFESGGEDFESESSKSQIDMNFGGSYYFADGIAGIANFQYSRDGFSDDDNDFSQSYSNWGFRIGGQYHLPDNLQNVFVQARVGFGAEGITSGSESDSEGSFEWGLTGGVYHHILPKVAIQLSAGYSSYSIGDPNLVTSGLAINTGLVSFIGAGSGADQR